MEILDGLREKLNIEDDEYEEMEEIIGEMEAEINSHDIYINDEIRVGFYSHMVSFIRRLKKNELVVDAADETVISQINEENMKLAVDIVNPLFEKYNSDYSESEVVLVAIYIQTSNEN